MTTAFAFGGSGTAAAALAFGMAIVSPTSSPPSGSALVRTQLRTATALPAGDRKTAAGSSLASTFIADLSPLCNQLFSDVLDRETSAAERVVGELRRWAGLSVDWDGEGAEAPNKESLKAAADFIRLLPTAISDAEPMLHANGRAGLYWNQDDLYADLEFLGDGRIAYFIRHSEDKHKGLLHFDSALVPTVLSALLEAPRVS
jgi:hypothetical protein